MKRNLREYDIAFTGLKLGEHRFDYQLDNKFFSLFEYDEFLSADLGAKVDMVKKESSLEFQFCIDGTVKVPCDITTEPFDLPLHTEMELVVKFGVEYDDSKDEILIIPAGEHKMNIAQYLYELSVLALPLKRLSKKGIELQDKEELLSQKSEDKNEGEEMDPRWEKLKDLLN